MADSQERETSSSQPTLEARLRTAAAQVETDLKRWIAHFNDEVVPDVRRNGSSALKAAAVELDKLARRMDTHDPPPPPDPSAKTGF